MWRLFVSFAASILGAVLLLRAPTDLPRTYPPVPLLPLATAPVITIPPSLLAELPPVIAPHWDDALALAMAQQPPPRRHPTLIAHNSARRAVALHTGPAAPPTLSPIGRMFAWLSAHAVHNAFSNDMVAGG